MASQTVPQVVPPRKEPFESIPQGQLGRILWLKREIERLDAELKQAEEVVRTGLETGATVEPGLLEAFLKTYERRSVAWKAVVERELGPAYAKRVLAATQPETYVSLVVTAGGAQ